MKRTLLLAITAVSALALSSGCIIKESSTSGSGGTSSSGGSGGSGGAGGDAGASSSGGSGGAGGMSGSGGAGGGSSCYTCLDLLNGNVPDDATTEDFCPGSAKLVTDLSDCTCQAATCQDVCAFSCETGNENMAGCETCITTSCPDQFNACSGDF